MGFDCTAYTRGIWAWYEVPRTIGRPANSDRLSLALSSARIGNCSPCAAIVKQRFRQRATDSRPEHVR
jgi:hypothetical protein